MNTEKGGVPLDDEIIIGLYQKRDERAIAETERKYGRLLSHLAHSVLKNDQDSEECCNDAYLSVWNAIPPARPKSLRAFCAAILRRIAINRYKERSAKKRIPSALTTSMEELERALCEGKSIEQEIEAERLGEAINGYVRGLSDREQFLFIGRYYFARDVGELAQECGVTKSAVYKELTKLKQGLREYLKKRGVWV